LQVEVQFTQTVFAVALQEVKAYFSVPHTVQLAHFLFVLFVQFAVMYSDELHFLHGAAPTPPGHTLTIEHI